MAEVRLLAPSDDRSGFSCGDPHLDLYFHQYAAQNHFRHHIGVTWVAVDQGQILGYATVSPGHVSVADLPTDSRSRYPRYPLPVLRLARLAVDQRATGRGIGSLLFASMSGLAHQMAMLVGCVGMIVDAKPGAVDFYTRLGFQPMAARAGALNHRPEPTPLFLPLVGVPRP